MARKEPVAQQLARVLGGSWKAVRCGFGYEYHGPNGRIVRSYAEPILDYDGYSDTRFLVYYSEDGGWTKALIVGVRTYL